MSVSGVIDTESIICNGWNKLLMVCMFCTFILLYKIIWTLKSVKLCMLGLWETEWLLWIGYYTGGSKLVEETEKDLGAWISADMKCSQQCRYAVNKGTRYD